MHNSDQKWPELTIDADLPEEPVHAGQRRLIGCVRMGFRRVPMRVRMDVIAVAVMVGVRRASRILDFSDRSRRANKRNYVHHAEND